MNVLCRSDTVLCSNHRFGRLRASTIVRCRGARGWMSDVSPRLCRSQVGSITSSSEAIGLSPYQRNRVPGLSCRVPVYHTAPYLFAVSTGLTRLELQNFHIWIASAFLVAVRVNRCFLIWRLSCISPATYSCMGLSPLCTRRSSTGRRRLNQQSAMRSEVDVRLMLNTR